MDILLEVVSRLAEAVAQLFLGPFFYISIVLVMLIYRRQVVLERKLFHVRLNSWGSGTWRTILGGLIAGIAVSVVSAFVGMTLSTEGIICIWVVSLLLLLFRVRYLCMAYAVGLLGLVQFILNQFPSFIGQAWIGEIVRTVRELDIPALLCLVALLHIAEAMLVRWQGSDFAGPLYYEGKRGRMVGGYQMQNLWPIPLFLLIPSQTSGAVLPWTPLFGGEAWQGGFGFIALPIMIGFSEMTIGMLPKAKAKITSARIFCYGIVILIFSLIATWWSPFTIVAALAVIVLHEGLILFSRAEEQQRSPLFVNPKGGVKVLAVVPDSPAEELGIIAGETIVKVNGMIITNQEELHGALRMNAAFCKIEVLNLEEQSKYLQRAIYAGEHHLLGAILAPDEKTPTAIRLSSLSIMQLLNPRRGISRDDIHHTKRSLSPKSNDSDISFTE